MYFYLKISSLDLAISAFLLSFSFSFSVASYIFLYSIKNIAVCATFTIKFAMKKKITEI